MKPFKPDTLQAVIRDGAKLSIKSLDYRKEGKWLMVKCPVGMECITFRTAEGIPVPFAPEKLPEPEEDESEDDVTPELL